MRPLSKIGLLLVIFFLSVGIGKSQESDSTAFKWNLIKSSLESDSYLQNLMNEQNRLSGKLHDLQEQQIQLEIERDKSETIPAEVIERANRLQLESDYLNGEIKNLRKELLKVQSTAEKKYFKNLYGVTRFIGKSKLAKDDKIYGNLCFINGKIFVEGIIKGDIAVINSDLFLASTGKIEGDIILINSRLLSENDVNENRIKSGTIDRNDEPYNEYAVEDNQYSFNFSPPVINLFGIQSISHPEIRYNRVEGLYIGMMTPKKYYWSGSNNHSIYGKIGYGFADHIWTGEMNVDLWTGNYNRTEFGGEVHLLVDSKDTWLINDEENSLSSFFIHEDFKDYFKKEGWSIHFSQYLEKNLRLKVDYISDKYSSLDRNTDWALFGGNKVFRENPNINDGKIKSTIFSLNYITVRGKDISPTGWNIFSSYEIANGDYEYNRFIFDLRRYQKLSDDIRINGRAILGSVEKDLTVQRSFDLGGLGTVPAARYKSLSDGNRMLLGNVELIIRIPDGDEFLPLEIFNGNDLIISYDAGMLRYMHPEISLFDGFENLKSDDFISDIGAAISFNRGSVRIGASFRLDKQESAKFFFRITQPF
jgi:hypothetical protein